MTLWKREDIGNRMRKHLIYHTPCGLHFGRGYGPVINRLQDKQMNE